MDYRTVDVESLRWTRTPRGASAWPKVVIQTPLLGCKISKMTSTYSQGHTLELRMGADDPLATEFAAFVDRVHDCAAAWWTGGNGNDGASGNTGSGQGKGTFTELDGSRTLRVTAFSDTLFFDADGQFIPSYSLSGAEHKGCTCLLELQGLWTAPSGKWGLRWRVAQVKFGDPPQTQTAGFAFVDDD